PRQATPRGTTQRRVPLRCLPLTALPPAGMGQTTGQRTGLPFGLPGEAFSRSEEAPQVLDQGAICPDSMNLRRSSGVKNHLFSCIEQNRWCRLQKRVFRTRKKTTSFLPGEKKVVIETESLKKPKKRTTCFAEIKRKGGFLPS
ncbi:MAG: hypothetical protein II084_07265, partial [Clostridia bacterium]|nr:hypothetical protein [Clostridia bacterium]